jgi:Glycosyl hydrolase family 76/Ricin-type beta-trefoil lectin domain-like
MRKFWSLAAGCVALAVIAAGVLSSPLAHSHAVTSLADAAAAGVTKPAAATLPSADAVFQKWNNAFLVQNGGEAYYTTELKSVGTQTSGTWVDALDIAVAEDVYERTHSPADWRLVKNLVTTFLAANGTNWASYDTWNDDLAWMTNATLRGYLITGNKSWLSTAMTQWNAAYNRGWTSAGGGGIWENSTHFSKCAVSNGPAIFNAVSLYRITGDQSYLTKAEAIYSWFYASLVDHATGQVNDCIAFPDGINGPTTLQAADLPYDAGVFIEAADSLYRATGNKVYYNQAVRTIDYWMDSAPIVSSTWGHGWQMAYWLFKGISDLCTDTGTCGKYAAYMRSDAARAWKERDGHDVTWNNWLAPTQDSDLDAFETSSMVGLYQVLPTTGSSPFGGKYHVKSAASGRLISVRGDSTASNAPIVDGGATASDNWTIVPESNGYYEIKNVRSGKLINVKAASGAPGAQLVQWPAQGLASGNDQWLPIRNANGTWSFYNRSSQLALSTAAAGTQLVQQPQNNTAAQQFTFIHQ